MATAQERSVFWPVVWLAVALALCKSTCVTWAGESGDAELLSGGQDLLVVIAADIAFAVG